MTELAPGIHRIESVLGPRPFSQYLLRGERSLLVDTGINATPADVILPFFETSDLDPEGLDYVVLSLLPQTQMHKLFKCAMPI